MVKSHYTTNEVSELLGISNRGVRYKAGSEGWTSRPRKGQGGGKEWELASMPATTRLAIAQAAARRIVKTHQAQPLVPQHPEPALSKVPERGRRRATARAMLVTLAREYHETSRLTRSNAYVAFAVAYNTRSLEVPEWVRDEVKSVSRQSLVNWEKAIAKQGVAAVAGRQGQHRKGESIIDTTPGMADYIVAELFEFHKPSAASILLSLEARFEGQRLPDLRTLQRWLKRYRKENEQFLLKAQNPDGWRSKYQSAAGSRSAAITRPNQLWELDSSPTDVLLADGKRYTLLACIDVATRRAVLHLAKTSSAQGVCSLLRRALLTFGVPESIKMDNGPDYTSHRVTSVLLDLGITPDWCKPYTPEEKPHVERFFRTFQHGWCEKLPGYIGHSVADRKAIESRRSFAERTSRRKGKQTTQEFRHTPEAFQRICTAWVQDNYNERRHASLKMSPNDAAASMGGMVRRITDERALDILLLPLPDKNGIRVVRKEGIQSNRGFYNAPQLGGMEGTEVLVKQDEYDAGYVYVFDLDGLYICRAEDPALTGVSLRELALARKTRQRVEIDRKIKEAKRLVAEIKPQETAAMINDLKARQAAKLRAARAAETSEPYSTDALDQAAIAAMSTQPLAPAPDTEQDAAARAELMAELAATQVPTSKPLHDLDGPEVFWRACQLEEQRERGETLTPEQNLWLRNYQGTKYYRSWREIYHDFGAAIFDGMEAVAI